MKKSGIEEYYKSPKYCIYCGKLIRPTTKTKLKDLENQKFCCRSCVSSYFNKLRDRNNKVGIEGSRFYKIWHDMNRRCYNTKCKAYKNYGNRGISVCDFWKNYITFREDMLESYLEHVKEFGEYQTTLDRIKVNGNYCKNNCKWSTRSEQNANIRQNKEFIGISPNGSVYEGKCKTYFAKEHNLSRSNIVNCLQGNQKSAKGWIFAYVVP